MTESAVRKLIGLVRKEVAALEGRLGALFPSCGEWRLAIAAAEEELEGEVACEACCNTMQGLSYHFVVGVHAPGRYAIRPLAPKREKVRPFVWHDMEGNSHWVCGRCGDHFCNRPPYRRRTNCQQPQCGVEWDDPQELPD